MLASRYVIEHAYIHFQTYQPRANDTSAGNVVATGADPDKIGLVNQWGLSRKVRVNLFLTLKFTQGYSAHLRFY
jgi:hypothetical protein